MILHMYKRKNHRKDRRTIPFFILFFRFLQLHYQNTRDKKWKKLKIKYNFQQEYLAFCFTRISFSNCSFSLEQKMVLSDALSGLAVPQSGYLWAYRLWALWRLFIAIFPHKTFSFSSSLSRSKATALAWHLFCH